jgi:predicted DNA-binding transcriptional regulator AlpA
MREDQQRLTSKEAAALLGVCVTWLWQRRQQIGTGPDFFRIGKKIFYYKNDIDHWRESRRNAGQVSA